jgi:replicative DNA helicase
LTYVVVRGGHGKTELCQQIIEAVALQAWEDWNQLRAWHETWIAGGRQGASVPEPGKCPGALYIMLGNMTRKQMITRTAARHSGVSLKTLRRGTLDMEQGVRVRGARDTVLRMPLEIVDDCPSTIPAVLGEMRRFAQRRPLVMCVVDNMSDILSVVPQEKMYSTAIGGAKQLKEHGAKELHCAVWLLMHTNSGQENNLRRDEVPRPRVPWSIEKDADFAFGIVRPFKYLDPAEPVQPKKLNAEGQEVFARIRREWQDKREPWPTGVRNVAELNPIKLREQDSDEADELARLYFDGRQQRFFDAVRQDAPASFDEGWGNT